MGQHRLKLNDELRAHIRERRKRTESYPRKTAPRLVLRPEDSQQRHTAFIHEFRRLHGKSTIDTLPPLEINKWVEEWDERAEEREALRKARRERDEWLYGKKYVKRKIKKSQDEVN